MFDDIKTTDGENDKNEPPFSSILSLIERVNDESKFHFLKILF